MHVSFKGMEGETKKEKGSTGAAFRVGRREWVYLDEAQNMEKICQETHQGLSFPTETKVIYYE